MAIRVPDDLAASIRQKIETGRYRDETEVIRAALRSLDAREERAERLRASIAEGLAAIERGEGRELTPELMDEIEREADERIGLGLLPKTDVCP
jgi:putative addiction module CopG family antidote